MQRMNHKLLAVVSALFVMIILPTIGYAAQRIITGCDKGSYERHRQAFPRESLGKPPNKFLKWYVALAKGDYVIQVLSKHDFDHAVFYKKGNGQFVKINIAPSSQISHNGQTMYRISFSANHANAVWANLWEVQVRPKGGAQNINHPVQLSIRHMNCSKDKSGKVNCRCPPGATASPSTFGTTTCIKNGKIVPEVCD